MKRVMALGFALLLGAACSPGGDEPARPAVTNALKSLDALVRKAERSTITFSRTEPFSQQAKITFQEAYRDWGQVRFQARLAFTPSDLQRDERLRRAVNALVSAADAWVLYLEFIEPSVEGEAPIESTRANDLLVEAKKKGAAVRPALQEALEATS